MGIAAGWIFAFAPFAVYVSVEWVWETALSTLLVSLVFLAALHLADSARPRAWLGFGLLCGLTALSNPAIVAVLPFLGAWLWYRLGRRQAHPAPLAAAAALAFLLSTSPWLLRNYRAFHQVIPFRSNFGLELRLGNYADGMGVEALAMHPSQNEQEMEKYRRMGEAAYITEKKREAFAFIGHHPAVFARLTALRVLMWWTGDEWKINGTSRLAAWGTAGRVFGFGGESFLALLGLVLAIRRGNNDAPAYAVFLIVYPLVYYVTFSMLRFRHPLEPVMLVLCAYAVRCAFYGERAGRADPAWASPATSRSVSE